MHTAAANRTDSCGLGAGRSQVQILSPRLEKPCKSQGFFRWGLCPRGSILDPVWTPSRLDLLRSLSFRPVTRRNGPGGRRFKSCLPGREALRMQGFCAASGEGSERTDRSFPTCVHGVERRGNRPVRDDQRVCVMVKGCSRSRRPCARSRGCPRRHSSRQARQSWCRSRSRAPCRPRW